jgi:hypothetical protein
MIFKSRRHATTEQSNIAFDAAGTTAVAASHRGPRKTTLETG